MPTGWAPARRVGAPDPIVTRKDPRSEARPPGPPRPRIVYSTDPSYRPPCPRCGRPENACVCPPPAEVPATGQTAADAREKRPGGKVVTVVRGLAPGPALDRLGKDLRARCGAGGTVKDGVVEVQGDHRERIAAALRDLGYRAKLAGG